uniref:Uncharacterized protein n=1 Tax=Noctiluca scintillans TaxID=2966 RepID=A0A7S1A154_NOCSC|mmetsp:Transcript_27530/g.72574  ORF Transcript_27530/g.72574 Transcript_27530/m.72574 type:complete len:730 (+) Transcript_27530:69-2258(+)
MCSVKLQICFVFFVCFSGEAARYVSGGNKADPTKSVYDHSAGKLDEHISALDAEVSAQQEKLDKLVAKKKHFEEEMSAKAEYNRKKDEQGRVAEASALKNITDSQKGRLEVEREIASFAKELAKQDAVRQQKIDALNDIMEVLTVRVDGQERPVVAKESEAAALQTMVDAVEHERSMIVDAMSATSKSEQDAAREEESLKQRVKELEPQREELVEQQASNAERQKARIEERQKLSEELSNVVHTRMLQEEARTQLQRTLEEKLGEQQGLTDRHSAVSSQWSHLKVAYDEKSKLLKDLASKKLNLDQQLREVQHDIQVISKDTQAKEHLMNTQAKELVSLQAVLEKSRSAVADARREQVSTLRTAREKEAATKALDEKLRTLEAEQHKEETGSDAVQQVADLRKEREHVDQEWRVLDMQSATHDKLAEAEEEEQRSLETQVAELKAQMSEFQRQFAVKQASLHQKTHREADVLQQVAQLEDRISELTSEQSALEEAKHARVSEMYLLREQNDTLKDSEEQLKAETATLSRQQRASVTEEKTFNESLSKLQQEFAETERVMEASTDKEKAVLRDLKAVPDQSKEVQLKEQKLQAERADLEVQEGLKASQEKMLQEQLDLALQEKDQLAKMKFEEERPLKQKVLERQALLDNMGGTPAEKAKFRGLYAKVEAFNLQETNAEKFIDTLARMSEDRERQAEESKNTFYDSYDEMEAFASDRLERAREESAELEQ